MKPTHLVFWNLLFLTHAVWAGSIASVPPVASEQEEAAIEWEVSAGYDTHYIYRGERLQKESPWVGLSLDVPLTDSLSWNLSPWYLHTFDGKYNELDLCSTLTYTMGNYEWSLGYSSFFYPRGGEGEGYGVGDEHEFNVELSRDIFNITASALAVYNVSRDGYYFEATLERSVAINDTFSVELSAALGFDNGYFDEGLDLNHSLVTLGLPITPAEGWALTPYVAMNIPFGHLSTEPTKLFGGVKLAFSF